MTPVLGEVDLCAVLPGSMHLPLTTALRTGGGSVNLADKLMISYFDKDFYKIPLTVIYL